MNKAIFVFLVLTNVIFLAACAGPTPYQPNGFAGGYSEEQLDQNVWKVKAEGNIYTDQMRIKDMLMLRAAELTVQNGYQKFAVIDRNLGEARVITQMPARSTTTGSGNVYSTGNTATAYMNSTTTYHPAQTLSTAPSPVGDIIVKMFKQNEAAKAALDAHQTIEKLKQKFSH